MVHNQAPHHRLIRYRRRPLKGHEDVEEERAWGVLHASWGERARWSTW
ncbi:hypothetical protein ES288_A01G110100v1 [Gossypium darwinii]|uniref:Uncharacterized protein n=1 Tax=Gossypium darwinii TaxID=34276 RepID=A0A5D2HKB2_GOSDA|nr:hypothetical protein ES288_A01G110100v1 [Gossypium darwinii]